MRSAEPIIINGPAVQSVPVFCEDEPRNRWITDDGWPGCKVVEGPLQKGASEVTIAVMDGQRAVICGDKTPWKVSPYTPEVAARAAVSAVFTAELGRGKARKSDGPGYLLDEHGERVLSLRLHDKCSHKEERWERKPCGHCWCKMCNGFVHPATRVALKGLTDVIKCSRK